MGRRREYPIFVRFSGGDPQTMEIHAKQLVSLRPDVIVVSTNLALSALRAETQTIPIVFAQVADPVGAGFVENSGKPGGNITGFSLLEHGLLGKWVELLKEISPGLTKTAVLGYPLDYSWNTFFKAIEAAGPSLGVQVSAMGVHNAHEIEENLGMLAREPNVGFVNLPNAITATHRKLVFRCAIQHHLPAVYHARFLAAEGGLVSDGAENIDLFRRAASYVDRVLKGERPGDLPIQFPMKYDLVVNMRTAKQSNIVIPETVLRRADEVIE